MESESVEGSSALRPSPVCPSVPLWGWLTVPGTTGRVQGCWGHGAGLMVVGLAGPLVLVCFFMVSIDDRSNYMSV